MKRKQITPEKAVKRLKVLMVAIFAMIAVIILSRLTNSRPYVHNISEIETAMDKHLDSLLASDYPGGTILLKKGTFEKLSSDSDKAMAYRIAKTQYDIQASREGADTLALKKEYEKVAKAQDRADREKTASNYYRWIMLQLNDTTREASYQWMSDDFKQSNICMRTKITNQQEEKENN